MNDIESFLVFCSIHPQNKCNTINLIDVILLFKNLPIIIIMSINYLILLKTKWKTKTKNYRRKIKLNLIVRKWVPV